MSTFANEKVVVNPRTSLKKLCPINSTQSLHIIIIFYSFTIHQNIYISCEKSKSGKLLGKSVELAYETSSIHKTIHSIILHFNNSLDQNGHMTHMITWPLLVQMSCCPILSVWGIFAPYHIIVDKLFIEQLTWHQQGPA